MDVRKVMGKLLALQVKVMSGLKDVARLPDDGMLDWLLSAEAEDAICEACATGWNRLIERWEKYQKEFFNLHSLLRTDRNLFVSKDFCTIVLAKETSSAKAVPLKSLTLERDMIDTEIEQSLGDNHLFTEVELCATLAKLIQEQWEKRDGKRLDNFHNNLFYTDLCVVRVFWYASGWNVSLWSRGSRKWSAGDRVFSPLPHQQAGATAA